MKVKVKQFIIAILVWGFNSALGQVCGPLESTITDTDVLYTRSYERVYVSYLCGVSWTSSSNVVIANNASKYNYVDITPSRDYTSPAGWIRATLDNGVVLEDHFDVIPYQYITELPTMTVGKEEKVEVLYLNGLSVTWTSSESVVIVSSDDNFAIITPALNNRSGKGWIKATLGNGITIENQLDINLGATITDISTIYGGQEIRVEIFNLNNETANWTSSELISIVSTADNFAIISTTSNEGSSNGWIKATLSNGIVLQDEFDIKTRPTITDISTIYGGQEIRVEIFNLNNETATWTSSELISIVSTDDNFAIISTTSDNGSSNGWIKATLSNGIVIQDEFDIKTRPTITDISTIYGGQEIRVEIFNLNNETATWTSSELISIVSTADNFAIISTTSDNGSSNGWIKATLSNGIVIQDEFDIKTRPTITDISTIYGGQEIRVEIFNLNNETATWTSSELISIVSTDDNFAIISTTSNEGSSNGWIKATLSNGIVLQDEFDIKTRPTITDISTIYGGQEIRVEIFNLNNETATWTSSELISIVSTDDNFAIISTTSNEGSSNGWIKATLSNGIVIQDEFDIKTRPTITDISILYIGGRKTLSVSNIDDLSITWTYSDNVFVPSRGGIYDNSITIMPASDVISGTGWVKATLSNGIVLQDEFDIRPVPTITPITSLLSGQKKKIEISNLNGQKVAYWTSTKNIKLSYVTNQNSGGMGGGPSPTSPFNPYDNDVLSDDGSSSIYASWNTESDDSGDNDDTGSESAAQYSNDNITEPNQNNSSCNIEHPNKNFYKLGIVTVVLQNGQQISQSMTLGSIKITKLGTLFFGKPENITVSNYLGDNFTLKWTSSENVKLFEKDDSNSGNTGSSSTSLIASETKSIVANENIDENGENGWVQVVFTENDNVNPSQRRVRLTFRISEKPYFYTNFTKHDEMELATLHGGEEKRVYISNLHGLGVNWEVSGVKIIETGDNSINITPLEGITTGKGSIKATLCNGIEVSHGFDIPKGPTIADLSTALCVGVPKRVWVFNLNGKSVENWSSSTPGLTVTKDNEGDSATIVTDPNFSFTNNGSIKATLNDGVQIEGTFDISDPKITDITALYKGHPETIQVSNIEEGVVAEQRGFSSSGDFDHKIIVPSNNPKAIITLNDDPIKESSYLQVVLNNGCIVRDDFFLRSELEINSSFNTLCQQTQKVINLKSPPPNLELKWTVSDNIILVSDEENYDGYIKTNDALFETDTENNSSSSEGWVKVTIDNGDNQIVLEHKLYVSNQKITKITDLYKGFKETIEISNLGQFNVTGWLVLDNKADIESMGDYAILSSKQENTNSSATYKASLSNGCSIKHGFNIQPIPTITDIISLCGKEKKTITVTNNPTYMSFEWSTSGNVETSQIGNASVNIASKTEEPFVADEQVKATFTKKNITVNGLHIENGTIEITDSFDIYNPIITDLISIRDGEEKKIEISNQNGKSVTWSSSSNIQIISSDNNSATIKLKYPSSSGSGWIKATLSNNCSVTDMFNILPKPTITDLLTLCGGEEKKIEISNLNGLTIGSGWVVSPNVEIKSRGTNWVIIKPISGMTSGSAWVKATLSNGTVLVNSFSISNPIITDLISIRGGEEKKIEISNQNGKSVTWSSSSNIQIISSDNNSATIKLKYPSSSGSGWIKATLSNGCSVTDMFNILPKPTITDLLTLCGGEEKKIEISNLNGLTIGSGWVVSPNVEIKSRGTNWVIIKPISGMTSGSAWVKATLSNGTVLVNSFSISNPIITDLISIRGGEEKKIEISNQNGKSVTWSSSSNIQIISSDNNSATIKLKYPSSSGSGWIKATLSNGCSVTDEFNILPKPTITDLLTLCGGEEKKIEISNLNGLTIGSGWGVSPNVEIKSRGTNWVIIKPISGMTSGSAWVKATLSNGTVLVNSFSISNPIITDLISIRGGEEKKIEISNQNGKSVTWSSSSNIQIISSDNNSATIKPSSIYTVGTGWIKATLSNGCSVTDEFEIYPIEPTIDNISQLCQGSTKRIYISNRGSHAVTWSTSSNLQIVSRSNDYVTVKPKSGYTSGEAWVQATLSNGKVSQEYFVICLAPMPQSSQISIFMEPQVFSYGEGWTWGRLEASYNNGTIVGFEWSWSGGGRLRGHTDGDYVAYISSDGRIDGTEVGVKLCRINDPSDCTETYTKTFAVMDVYDLYGNGGNQDGPSQGGPSQGGPSQGGPSQGGQSGGGDSGDDRDPTDPPPCPRNYDSNGDLIPCPL